MYDLIAIGGGPAGSAAALTAAEARRSVLLLERGVLPRQKVCGEFISPEALGILAHFLPPDSRLLSQAPGIAASRLFFDSHPLTIPLSPAGASIPRWELDHALWQAAEIAGIDCRLKIEVDRIEHDQQTFVVHTSAGTFFCRSVVDASGRWSRLRPQPAPAAAPAKEQSSTPIWLGLKAHFEDSSAVQSIPTTDLYFFESGYCGVQPAGAGRLNVCAMVRSDMATRLIDVFELHPSLLRRSREWSQATDQVATAPLIFYPPCTARENVLCAGDAAGFIDPFAGDGISLALRSGILAGQALLPFWQGSSTLDQAIDRYRQAYESQFAPAFRGAARLRRAMNWPRAVRSVLIQALNIPKVAEWIVRSTR
jgi:flavin-dependent dehydrogenase